MLYRIDYQHFLTHAIDYFTQEELIHFKYVIISSSVANLSKQENVVKRLQLYPTTDIVLCYEETHNKQVMRDMYLELLEMKSPDDEYIGDVIYTSIINPVLHHNDIVIVCDRDENDYMDVLCEHLKKSYSMEAIDLNKLFAEGHIGPIYIDKDRIRDKAVDIRKSALTKEIKNIEKTRDGRLSLLNNMTTKAKMNKLKQLGIKVTENDKDNLNELLIDAWVNENEDG